MRIFVSHQWMDKQLADRLARDLEQFGDVWMDYRRLRPGDRIQATIDAALEQVDLVLVVWTENARRSEGVAAEISASVARGIRIVPCVFAYDEAGAVQPPLPDELADVLAVDFHHYGTGVAQLANLILQLEAARLPSEASMADHPGMRMLEYLRGYMQYLANYRSVRGVADDRVQWIDKIIGEIERYLEHGGDSGSVRALVDAARGGGASNDDGIDMLIERLEPALARHASHAGVASAGPAAGSVPGGAAREWRAPPPPPRDELARRVAAVVPPGQEAAHLGDVDAYIAAAPQVLDRLDAFARSAASPAGMQVVGYLRQYLATADDLIPAHHGRFGLLDDAWLILNTAFRLIESGLLPAAAVPIDWQAVARADCVVQAVMPREALEAMSGIVLQLLQVIAAEVASYQPWFAREGRGYAPTLGVRASRGGSWEDQINEALLGTGLSV
jgi:hypothetical protein